LYGSRDHAGDSRKEGRTRRALDEVVRFVEEHRVRYKPGDGDFADFERELHARVMHVEREVLCEELERADVDEEAVEIDGVVHRRALRSRRQYMTAAGVVEVERTLFRDRSDPYTRTIAALDAKLGIIDEFWTPLAAQQASWVVSQMCPQLGAELLERMGNMTPSKASLDRLPKELHERFEMDAESFEQTLREGTVVPQDTVSIAVSLDGVLLPMNDGDAVGTREQAAQTGKLTKGPAGYREASCATVSFCDASGEMISAIRFGRMPEHKKERLKQLLTAQVRHIVEREPHLKLIKLADGAEDNWSYLSSDALPQAPECIDFYHAAEHLSAVLGQAYGDGSVMARRRFAELRHVLLEEQGGVETVIGAIANLKRKTGSAVIARELGYFRNNRARMRYAELKARGFPVGSGVVEAACKTLVAQRMKQSGMRWSHDGGQAILNLRGWSQSGRFDAAWALLAATYKMQVTTVASIVRLRAR
jgi:hypothetical protein